MKAQTIETAAKLIADILRSDRWVFLVCDGRMGEGKSCFTSQLAKAIARETGTAYSYDKNMTYKRSELKEWVDGDKDGKNQKPEYSVILADELISMFFKRNWFDSQQIDGIELLNKCRDRHLCVIGNIPHFWDLDSAIYPICTFWVHIAKRGIAFLYAPDANPHASDKWHKRENEKIWRKRKTPEKQIGFYGYIKFDDWSPQEKERYYAIRNTKRKNTEGQRTNIERYGNVKKQRDEMIKFLWTYNKELVDKGLVEPLAQKDIADISGLTPTAIGYILRGER